MSKRFSTLRTLSKAVSFLKSRGVCHGSYCHYTSLENVRLMMQSKTFWLRRCDSQEFDDRIEQKKYGSKLEQSKFFLSCFSYEEQELASMWGLYCPPTYQAVRLKLPKSALSDWVDQLSRGKIKAYRTSEGKVVRKDIVSIKSAGCNDIVYASVKECDDDTGHDDTLSWFGKRTQAIAGLKNKKNWKSATGLVKDADWGFERECRLWVKTRDDLALEQLAIEVPGEVIENMEFTLSPWLKDYEDDFVRSLVRKWVDDACGNKGDGIKFFNSGLRGGLQKWAARRGV